MLNPTLACVLIMPLCIGMCTNGEVSDCDKTLPKARVLATDSLSLIPFSYTHHYTLNEESYASAYRTIRLTVSKRDSSNAYVHLDSNGLGLFLDRKRIDIPAPSYSGGDGWHCPSYNEWSALNASGEGRDTAFLLEIRKDSVPVRSWSIAFRFDSTKVPAIRIDSLSGGLGIEAHTMPGTRFDKLTFSADGAGWYQELEMIQAANVISSSILIKNLWGFQRQRYASEIHDGRYLVCLNSTAGIESITVNGETSNLQTEICQELTPGEKDMILGYLRSRCLDCK